MTELPATDHKTLPNEIEPLISAHLENTGFSHGFFTRKGGISQGIYQSLNCGRGSKDKRISVEHNRAAVANRLGAFTSHLIGVHQCHSAIVAKVEQPWLPTDAPHADAIVTTTPGLAISILTADCAPILFADHKNGVVAAAHAGWKGAKAGIIEATIRAMIQCGADRSHIKATIGPMISQASYEVGEELYQSFLNETLANARFFKPSSRVSHYLFNLPAYVGNKIDATGVVSLENFNRCTYQDESNFFSYRRSVHRKELDYGRQIASILIS